MSSFSQEVETALIDKSIHLTCDTLLIKIKNWIWSCSVVSRVFIYASNEPL